jgi:predicted amidohydrolase
MLLYNFGAGGNIGIMTSKLRVGACQTPEILGDINAAVECARSFIERGENEAADLLVFPECFLQGYLVEAGHIEKYALELASESMSEVLVELAHTNLTLVLGFIELEGGKYYNSAAVINRGRIVGIYRKNHLLTSEAMVFSSGVDYPVFELNGVKYGINICYDAQFAEAAAAVAAQGASLLLLPAQNMLKIDRANEWKYRHNELRRNRVEETGMWLVSSDVTGRRGETHVGYGPTAAINPRGEVSDQVPLLEIGMIVAEIG